MKYYSDKTQMFYETEDEAIKAEKEYDKQKAREQKEIEVLKKKREELEAKRADRFKEVKEAYEYAEKLKREFLKDYGSIKLTLTSKDMSPFDKEWLDSFDNMFEMFDKFTSRFWY